MIDGDTIKIDRATYGLWGIDAAECRQTCLDGWPAPASAMAFDALRTMVAGHTVACEPRTTDRYSRTVAICRGDGFDFGAEMVRAGHALAFVHHSSAYLSQEDEARVAKVGVHAHDCVPAWKW